MIINMSGTYKPPDNIVYVPTSSLETYTSGSFPSAILANPRTINTGFQPTQIYGYSNFESKSGFGKQAHCGDYAQWGYGMNKNGVANNKSGDFTWYADRLVYVPYKDDNWKGTVQYYVTGYWG